MKEEKFEWGDKYISILTCLFLSILHLFSYPSTEFIEEWNCEYMLPYSYFIHFILSFLVTYVGTQLIRLIIGVHILSEYIIFKINNLK